MKRIFIFTTFFWGLYCSSGFYKKENIYLSESLAIYLLDEKDYPEKELRQYTPPVLKFPENSTENLKILLKTLIVEKEGFFTKDTFNVFFPNQLEEIFLVLKDILPKTKEGQRIFVIHKHDPYKTALSKYKRTTFLLWYDKNGYNIIFGDIAEDLIPDLYSNDLKWLDIFPVSFKQANPKQRILPNEYIEFKKVGDFTHYTWILSTMDQIEAIKNKQLLDITPKTSLEERLKKLKELYENKLISESEYEAKKKEILKDF